MVAQLQITLTLLGSAPVILLKSKCKNGSRVIEDVGCEKIDTDACKSEPKSHWSQSHTLQLSCSWEYPSRNVTHGLTVCAYAIT